MISGSHKPDSVPLRVTVIRLMLMPSPDHHNARLRSGPI